MTTDNADLLLTEDALAENTARRCLNSSVLRVGGEFPKNAGPTLRGAARSRIMQEGPRVCCGLAGRCGSTSTPSWSTLWLRQKCTQHQHSVVEYFALAPSACAAPLCRGGVRCIGARIVPSTPSWSTSRLRQECAQHQFSVVEHMAQAPVRLGVHCACVFGERRTNQTLVSSTVWARPQIATAVVDPYNTVVYVRSVPASQTSQVEYSHLGHFLFCGGKELF